MPPTLKRYVSLKKLTGEERKGRPVSSRQNSTLQVVVEKEKRTRSRSRLGRDAARRKEKKPKKKANVGLLVTKEFAAAVEATRKEIERIANDCRANNRKFRCEYTITLSAHDALTLVCIG